MPGGAPAASERVRGRDLHALFVPPRAAARATVDRLHDALGSDRPVATEAGTPTAVPETGPVAEETEALTSLPPTWPARAARHPGLLAVLATLVVAVTCWRGLLGAGALTARQGLVGGELAGLSADAAGLWHAFVDGWHGPGLGGPGQSAPYLAVLAGLAWLVARTPFVDPAGAPAAVAIAWLLLAAMPLSAASAYVGGRAVTSARWPRAWAALAWGTLATLTAAVGAGRLGAVVAHLLLPLVLAGYLRVATGRAGTSGTVATALAVAVLGAFCPPLLVLAVLGALVLLVRGPGALRVRAAVARRRAPAPARALGDLRPGRLAGPAHRSRPRRTRRHPATRLAAGPAAPRRPRIVDRCCCRCRCCWPAWWRCCAGTGRPGR